jgi:beta-galactosidase
MSRKEVVVKLNHKLMIVVLCAALAPFGTAAAMPDSPRVELSADSGWKFFLGDPKGAEASGLQDQSWRTIDVPHDWSIEGRPDKNNPSGSGGGFFPTGTGWYRKTFTAAAGWKGKRVSVEFDGVYRNATVYLNGHQIGTQPYGYTSFSFDLTPQLSFTTPNVLAVRVDNSAQPNSRWYSGSGIYRHVRVVVTNPAHVAHWGVFVTAPEASATTAKVLVRTRVANDSASDTVLTVETTLLDAAGQTVGAARSPLQPAPGSNQEISQDIAVTNPSLWSPASPVLYRAVTRVRKNDEVLDEVVTPFGIRTIAWSADQGLLLNGKPVKLNGGSVHHDNGPLGAAAFDRAEERRVELLKAAGHNAVRTAHNPPSPAFLDACDRLGLLVLDEPFDAWKAHKAKFDYGSDFDEWWNRDLSAMVLRDRNHPSIVIWGIGNEIPELEVERGGEMARKLADQVRSLDNSRPLTLAFPGTTTTANAQAVFSLLDITGYNYSLQTSYADDHTHVPSRMMLTTESFPAYAFRLWKLSAENPYILGDLTWTSMDYLGESGIGAWSYATPEQAKAASQIMGGMTNTKVVDQMFLGMANGLDMNAATSRNGADPAMQSAMAVLFHGYPWHAAACGDLDLTGYRKPQSYYRDIIWNRGDRVYATVRLPEPEGQKIIAVGWAVYPTLPSWNWPGEEGKTMQVEVYSGTEKVQLFLNGKLIGEQPTGRDQEFKATFSLPYAPGTLRAVGLRDGRAVTESILATAGKASKLLLTADRTAIQADGQDLSFVTVEAVDSTGRLQPLADQEVRFSIDGPAVIAAVGNGDGQDNASYQGDRRKLYQGRALVVIRTSKQNGPITLTAKTTGLQDGVVKLHAQAVEPRPELK